MTFQNRTSVTSQSFNLFQPVLTQFNYVQLRSMIGSEASGAPHAHQEDQPMTEARLFSDDKFNAIWTEARWVSELDMAGPL